MALVSLPSSFSCSHSVSVGHKEAMLPVKKKECNAPEVCVHPNVEILTPKVMVLGGGILGGN